MTDADFGPFEAAFKRLSGALNRKWTTAEFKRTVQIFFDTLQHADLVDVLAAEPILRARNRWPKAGDWLAALPNRPQVPAGMRVMGVSELDEYRLAQGLRWDDPDGCQCLVCQAAETTAWPLRFVPDFTADDVEARAFCPTLNRELVTGHWAHGHELRRWYLAKGAFEAAATAAGRRWRFPVTREPGVEG